MIKSIQETLTAFYKRDGLYVIAAAMMNKLFRFLIQIFVIRSITNDAWGDFSYAIAVINFVLPFAGLGVNHSLLRFGALLKTKEEKRGLFAYSLKRGIFVAVIWALVIYSSSSLFQGDVPGSQKYLQFLAFYLVSFFVFELIKVYFLVQEKKRWYAASDILYSILMLIGGALFTYVFGVTGYAWTLILVPLLVFIGFFFSRKTQLYHSLQEVKPSSPKAFFKYGLYVGLGAVAAQLMFSVDIILLGDLLEDSVQIALYRTAAIIPLNLMFVPVAYFTSDSTLIASHYQDRKFLVNYVKGFMPIFIAASAILCIVLYYLSDWLILLIFKEKYEASAPMFRMMLWAVAGAFILRAPFGNILGAVGKSNWNAFNAIILLFLNVGFNYWLISLYGTMGAAYATSLSIWVSGILAALCFLYYLRSLKP